MTQFFAFHIFYYNPYLVKARKLPKFRWNKVFFGFQFSQIFFSLVFESKLPLCNFWWLLAVVWTIQFFKKIFDTIDIFQKSETSKENVKFFKLKSHSFSLSFSFPFGFDAKFSFASVHLFCTTRSCFLFLFYQDRLPSIICLEITRI